MSEVPEAIQQRIDRGVKRMREEAPGRNLSMEFWRGNHFSYLNSDGNMTFMATAEPEKPRHRYRLTRNLFFDIIEREVSRTTQRVPGYEIQASTMEPNDYYAAKTSEKVARSQYPVWKLHRATEKVVRLALVQDMGFAWPYFDNQKGTVIDPEQGLAEGEICVETYSPNEVFWEPGIEYEKSKWMGIQQAKPLDEVRKLAPGLKELKADASISSGGGGNTNRQKQATYLVMVTEYFERPSMQNPMGKWCSIVNNKIIDEKPFPVVDTKGQPLDEPVLVPLSYAVDPDSDTDMGLGRHLVDPMRTIVDCINKCVSGETLVTTRQGLKRADELEGKVEILAGDGRFREADWKPYGVERLWRVTFDDGSEVHATQNHRWPIREYAKERVVTTPMLEGKSVPICTLAAHTPVEDVEAWHRGVQNGLMWGDGTVERHKRSYGKREYVYGSIRQYASEDNVAVVERFFPHHTERRTYEGRQWVQARQVDPELKSIPSFDKGVDYLRGFLAGAIASDGTVSKKGNVNVGQANRADLEAVATIARSVGIAHSPIREWRAGYWGLTLDKRSFVDDSGVDCNLVLKPYHQENLEHDWGSRAWRRQQCRTVISVEPSGRIEQTYCCTEPQTGMWTLGNGLLTGNCLQWKNMALNPQIIIRNGVWKGPKLNDAPGMVYRVFGNADPKFREVPPIPPELFTLIDHAREDMNRIAGQQEPPSGVESGKSIQAWESIQERRAAFVGKLAEFHGHLMRRCLTLVQLHYSEERLLKIQGRYGPEILSAFRGADLRSQVDVTVRPGSLEPRSKEGVKQELMNLVQMFPGAFSPEQVMAAMEQGTAEKLLESYELDVRRAHEVIQKIKVGPQVLFSEPPRPIAPGEGTQIVPEKDPMGQPTGRMIEQPIMDPETGQPIQDVPGWLPRPFDNIAVQKKVMQDFAKTSDFDMLEPGMKAATFQYLAALDEAEQRIAQKQQLQQTQMAEQVGMQNATKDGGQNGKPLPSMPSLS